jgi:DNA-binding response OmpR family regulator
MVTYKRRILVIDDDPQMIHFLKDFLAVQGYEVIAQSSAKKAVQVARWERPDLIILDVMMPDSGGFNHFKELRECQGPGTVTPVIIYSAAPSFMVSSALSSVQGLTKEDFVQKGADPKLLFDLVKKRLPPAIENP